MHLLSVRTWTWRILPDGFSFSIFVHTAPQRLANFCSAFLALCAHSPRVAADFLHALSLVLPGGLPGLAGGEDVFRHRGLSPLFFAPLVQDQPRVSVRNRVHGHDFFSEGRAVVGGASSPPSPAFRPGTGFAFANPFRILLVARRLDYFRQIQLHSARNHHPLRQLSRAARTEQIPRAHTCPPHPSPAA